MANCETIDALLKEDDPVSTKKKLYQLGWIASVFLLVACGSGGGNTSNAPNSESNTPPVAEAGLDQFVELGDILTLNASSSTDADGDLLTYKWSIATKPLDSDATINNSNAMLASFMPDVHGNYTLRLVVNDGEIDSQPADIAVTTLVSVPVTIKLPQGFQSSSPLRVMNGTTDEIAIAEATPVSLMATPNPQLSLAVDDDKVVYLALTRASNDTGTVVINALSTAQSLVVLNPAIAAFLKEFPEQVDTVMDELAKLSEFAVLATLIDNQLVNNESGWSAQDEAFTASLIDAMEAAYSLLETRSGTIEMRGTSPRIAMRSVDLSPDERTTRSGLRVTIVSEDLNGADSTYTVKVENNFDRYVVAEIKHSSNISNSKVIKPKKILDTFGGFETFTVRAGDLLSEEALIEVFGPGITGWENVSIIDPRLQTPIMLTVSFDLALPLISILIGSDGAGCLKNAFSKDGSFIQAITQKLVADNRFWDALQNGKITQASALFSFLAGEELTNQSVSIGSCVVQKAAEAVLKKWLGFGFAESFYNTLQAAPGITSTLIDIGRSSVYEQWSLTNTLAIRATADITTGAPPLEVNFDVTCLSETACAEYRWNFDDGTNDSESSFLSLSERTHVFDTAGTYNVTVMVTDRDGAQQTSEPITIVVDNGEPEIVVKQGQKEIQSGASPGHDFGDATVDTSISKTFTVENTGTSDLLINFILPSDGTAFTVSQISSNPIPAGKSATFSINFSPIVAGVQESVIMIGNTDSDESNFEFTVTGNGVDTNTAPNARFTITSTTGNTQTTFSVDASATTDLQDSLQQLQFRWNWDGGAFPNWDNIEFSSSPTATHTYTAPGTYTVWLQVIDTGGFQSTVPHDITVSDAQPSALGVYTVNELSLPDSLPETLTISDDPNSENSNDVIVSFNLIIQNRPATLNGNSLHVTGELIFNVAGDTDCLASAVETLDISFDQSFENVSITRTELVQTVPGIPGCSNSITIILNRSTEYIGEKQ